MDKIRIERKSKFQLTKSSFRKVVHHSTFGLILRCCSVVTVVTVTSVYIVVFVRGLSIRQDHHKSLSDQVHNRKHVVFLKIPKTGEDYLEGLLEQVAKQNGVPFVAQKENESRSSLEQKLANTRMPSLWSSHSGFFYPNSSSSSTAVFITLICDPITKFKGHYYSRHEESKAIDRLPVQVRVRQGFSEKRLEKNLSQFFLTNEEPECVIRPGQIMSTPTRYFCPDRACAEFASRRALKMAEDNAERHFAVVGIFERMEETLEKLEKVLPHLFKGVTRLHNQKQYRQTKTYNMSKKPLTKQAYKKLKDMLSVEYEFYEFVRKKLDE